MWEKEMTAGTCVSTSGFISSAPPHLLSGSLAVWLPFRICLSRRWRPKVLGDGPGTQEHTQEPPRKSSTLNTATKLAEEFLL